MGKLNKDNLRKTLYYLKKNGIKNTLTAMAERLQSKETDSYAYVMPAEEILQKQRERVWPEPITFSILVPLYHTPEKYFKELLESVRNQTYSFWQLILLDASKEQEHADILQSMVKECDDERVRYYRLAENKGIAENTNAGIPYVTGEYVALLDHDDLLTEDALYEMADAIAEAKKQGITLQMIYSDEDKCDGEAKSFYEPHFKKDFDAELLLTNNYICHFTAVKAELFAELKLRGEYNGAQDFDLVLRVADKCKNSPQAIYHIPKVLYHWRCHTASTAANPASKMYAYEAGKRAVEAFVAKQGWKAEVEHLKHLGFYKVTYENGILKQRPEVGAVGGSIINRKNRIIGGMQDELGNVIYDGLRKGFSGYMNRASLAQEAEVLDVRCMCISKTCEDIFFKSLQEAQVKLENGEFVLCTDAGTNNTQEVDWPALSKRVCGNLRKAGYRLVWDPEWFVR